MSELQEEHEELKENFEEIQEENSSLQEEIRRKELLEVDYRESQVDLCTQLEDAWNDIATKEEQLQGSIGKFFFDFFFFELSQENLPII